LFTTSVVTVVPLAFAVGFCNKTLAGFLRVSNQYGIKPTIFRQILTEAD